MWTWDISYLKSPVRGLYFYLYLMIDVFSRKIVGWQVHEVEDNELASQLFVDTCAEHGLDPRGLVLHADNGAAMKGATLLATLQSLGVIASFSRPRVSDDNAFSEALFRTLKYRPDFPDGAFASIATARAWMERFVDWYNTEHRHSALRFVTPNERHEGRDVDILRRRQKLYHKARQRHPERWSGPTRNWQPVGPVVLNPDKQTWREMDLQKTAA